jgi:CheY-like chemotaxis protein
MEDFVNRKMKHLLIIEDDDNLRKSIVRLIGNGDVKCCEAGTGAEALAILRTQPIDCVVLDIGLPDISGFELIRQLEQDKTIRVPPVIVYTGRELTKAENEELEQYAETIIVKGVKSEERLLDETALFLHRTLSQLPPRKRDIITSLYDQATQLHDKQILLVDDDMRNVFALSKVLTEQGMKVIKADNGRVALQALADQPGMDFVLMDIMMPEMDGYECMREIRQQSRFRDLPIVALTAKAMKDDRKKCIDAGANDYVAKPVDVDRLLSLMRIWIRK